MQSSHWNTTNSVCNHVAAEHEIEGRGIDKISGRCQRDEARWGGCEIESLIGELVFYIVTLQNC